jgi:L-ascorbate metabolism protein UlaG (beta-lactamase superfamily)
LLPDLGRVKAILVGHAHYDHLMSVPFIARERAPDAYVYGSKTMVHMLAGEPFRDRLVAVNGESGSWHRPGRWIPVEGTRVRLMALHSEHASHLLGVKVFKGKLATDHDTLPRNAHGWKEGQTYAFLVDFLAETEERPVFRIHYQDAASTPPYGFPPPLDDGVPVDVAIVNVAAFGEAEDYPEGIVRELQPRHVILSHWEDFFRSPERERKVVRATSFEAFRTRLESALPEWRERTPAVERRWTLPDRDAVVSVRVCDSGH